MSALERRARPVIVTELLRDDSVVCDTPEATASLAWARERGEWDEHAPAIWLHDSIAERLARGIDDVAPGIAPR